MPNRVLKKLIEEKIEIFRMSFSNAKEIFYDPEQEKLIHPGELGIYREKAVGEFIRSFIPNKLNIDSGFVINNNDEISHQCDIVIFDSVLTPNLHSSNNQRFFPIETVVSVGEVKSVINSIEELKTAVIKLSKVKIMRENIIDPFIPQEIGKGYIKGYSPQTNCYDQICTFLVCEKFGFDIKKKYDNPEDAIAYLYKDIKEARFKHNLILSIEDGLFLYDDTIGAIGYPVLKENLKGIFITAEKDHHFIQFIIAMTTILGFTTILSPDFRNYIYETK